MSRRTFVQLAAGAAGAAAFLRPDSLARAQSAARRTAGRNAEELAADESYWADVQGAFDVDRSLINLNNGGCSPAPRVVQEALKRYIDFSNGAPVHSMWEVLEPRIENVRRALARAFGCDADELAVTRNASESLETCLLGLTLKPGDEILCTDQEYPRMMTTLRQRARREGIVVKTFPIPVPARSLDELARLYEQHITSRTRMLLVCHVNFMTGQVFPIKQICDLARRRDIPCVVDGAHAFAQFAFSRADLGCDYYGTSLHKWLNASVGAGFLFVRRDRINSLWPLMAAEEKQDADIRKFEEIGTHPAANRLIIAEALAFHRAIGPARKEARLRFLRDRWAKRLPRHERVRLLTNLDPAHSCAMGTMAIDGIDPAKLQKHLFDKHRVLVAAIDHPNVKGIRVTGNVYTQADEVDRFCEIIEGIIRHGLPIS